MKATVYVSLFLLTAGALVWMVYETRRQSSIDYIPTGDFDADDTRLYNLIRADLQAYEQQKNKDPLAWLDDEVLKAFPTSMISGRQSKTAAYVTTLIRIKPGHPKARNYKQMLSNLTKRYT